MANDYFDHSANIVPSRVRALAAHVNNIATEIATGFDKFPTLNQLKYQTSNYAVDTGAVNAYVVTVPFATAPFALTDGMETAFKTSNPNSGASTLNVNGLGAKSIVTPTGAALTTGAITRFAVVKYDLTNDRHVLISATGNAAIEVTAAEDGGFNLLIGSNAGSGISSATDNTLVGREAGDMVTTGSHNVAIGYQSLSSTVSPALTGADNIAIGYTAIRGFGSGATTSHDNIAIGRSTMESLGTGNYNVGIGVNALRSISSGSNNVAIGGAEGGPGHGAGANISTGSGNVCIGPDAGPVANQSNRLYIHNDESDTPLIGGDFSGGTLNIHSGTTEVLRTDGDATAGNTRLMIYDVDNATLERVTVGATDSGGGGFKVLRIPN